MTTTTAPKHVPLDTAAIAARASAAQAGPWEGGTDPHENTIEGPGGPIAGVMPYAYDPIARERGEDYHRPTAVFIAAARTDVPALVAEVETLRALAASLLQAQRDFGIAGADVAELAAEWDITVQYERFVAARDALAAAVGIAPASPAAEAPGA